MAAAAAGAGKTLRLRLAEAGVAAVIPQECRQAAQVPVQAVNQRPPGRGSTFRALTAAQAQATTILGTTEAVEAVGPPMRLPLQQTVAADRYMAAAAGVPGDARTPSRQ
jgi:hypothetical protein